MSKILVLSSDKCAPCKYIKKLFMEQGIEFTTVDVNNKEDFEEKNRLIEISKIRMIPQIFLEENGITEFLFKGVDSKEIEKLKK